MSRKLMIFLGLLIVVFGIVVASRDAAADDYVWARSPWGNGSWGRNYGGMSNGYGGYYVRRNGYGNNYESRGHFTNPNGYIIPAEVNRYPVTQPAYVTAAPARRPVVQKSAVPLQVPRLQPNTLPPKANYAVPSSTIQTAPKPPAPEPVK